MLTRTMKAMEKPVIRISVRHLVEFILRSGDLTSRSGMLSEGEAMQAGSRLHKKIQKSRGSDYQSEVFLSGEVTFEDMVIGVEGRADGLYKKDGRDTIEEIKGVYRDVSRMKEAVRVHLAQARCYGALLKGFENQEASHEEIGIDMTYVNLDDETVRTFDLVYTVSENGRWFLDVVEAYHRWEAFRLSHVKERNASALALSFPFVYREGQKRLVASVYHAIHAGRQLFIEAPTGVGKTMAVIFPAVRSMGEGTTERLFYLTANTVTGDVAVQALQILRDKGLKFKFSQIRAKEKLCPMSEVNCQPDYCPYAKGHFDRINDALFELLNHTDFYDADAVLREAGKRMVCPYELSLDASQWADGVIGDYNYVFDPDVRLKRFFGDSVKGYPLILVDEAHNLVERGREMFSASLCKEHVLATAGKFKGLSPRLEKSLRRLNKVLLDEKHKLAEHREMTGKSYAVLPSVSSLETAALRLFSEFKAYFEKVDDASVFNDVSAFFFELRKFLQTAELLDENYRIYAHLSTENEFRVRLACMNPAVNLQSVMDKAVDTVFFSATLLPMDYHKNLFSCRQDDYGVYATSPFSDFQRGTFIGRDVSSRYGQRGEKMYYRIARYIHDIVLAHQGNYMVFFPSYQMLDEVFEVYRRHFEEESVDWVVQSRGMMTDDREIFLENFYEEPVRSLIGFCVMGSVFSEGIDLTGTRLVGAIIIGTGLPQISSEREIVREFYEDNGRNGFDYAYRIPGMNKVMQAAGRVIRTEKDRGIIALLDGRFLEGAYRRLFPNEWQNFRIMTCDTAGSLVRKFWNML